jgi:DNA-binding transcriptional ArsR family regulator
MRAEPDIAQLTAVITERTRAAILVHLLDGRSWTATELTRIAGVKASATSAHLKKLLNCGLIKVSPTGRHRYFRLAEGRIATLIEQLQGFAPLHAASTPGQKRATATLRACRLCYDHLAGRLGVALTDAMVKKFWLIEDEPWFRLTDGGMEALSRLDIVPSDGRTCMDWSERKLHLAGALGTRLAQSFLDRRFLLREKDSRALRITALGAEAIATYFGVSATMLQDTSP